MQPDPLPKEENTHFQEHRLPGEGRGLYRFPRQPAPVLDHPFHEETLLNIQPKCPLV